MFWKKWFEPKPFNQGYLPKLDGHEVFFREFGNPKGKPVLVTHGGPGYETKVHHATDMDLKKFRVIMMDQRGCGRSIPFGEIKNNTTQDAVKDMKRVLDYLKIKRKVIVKGNSWASALALLFAETYPDSVEKLLLSMIFIPCEGSLKGEMDRLKDFYPEFYEKMISEVKGKKSVQEFYADLINSDKAINQYKAYNLYGRYEHILGYLNPDFNDEEIDDKYLAYNKIFINYEANEFYVKGNPILENADKIRHIPILMVHNRLDMLCPLGRAFEIHRKLPKSKLVVVPELGHSGKLLKKTFEEEIRKFA